MMDSILQTIQVTVVGTIVYIHAFSRLQAVEYTRGKGDQIVPVKIPGGCINKERRIYTNLYHS